MLTNGVAHYNVFCYICVFAPITSQHIFCFFYFLFLNISFMFWTKSKKLKYHSLVTVIRKHFICQIATLQPIPSHQLLFAQTSHSHWMTSSLRLIRFAIFRALDIYSANSVNIVFLQQPSLVWSKPELMAIAACIYTVDSAVRYYCRCHNCLFGRELLLSLSVVGGAIVPLCSYARAYSLCTHFVFHWDTLNTMEKSATCWSVTDLLMQC